MIGGALLAPLPVPKAVAAKQVRPLSSAAASLPPAPAPDAVDEFMASLTVDDLRLCDWAVATSSSAASAPVERSDPAAALLRKSSHFVDALDDMRCPISMELMRDPVICADGQSYERVSIENWLKKSSLSPLTGLELEHKMLIPNVSFRKVIEAYSNSRRTKAERNEK